MSINIEEFDALVAYLHERSLVIEEQHVDCTQLSGGVSNRAVLVAVDGVDRWVVKQALEKLRVQVDWFSSPERIHREAAGLRALGEMLPTGATPAFVFEDRDEHILVMDAVPQPHANWKSMLLAGELQAAHIRQFGAMLARIHGHAARNHVKYAKQFVDRHFFETLRIEPYYRYSAQQVPAAADFIAALIDATNANIHTLVHGDYSPKNILVYQDTLVLLDHEVIHWGDPAFDIGFSMTHLLSKAHHLVDHRPVFQDAARQYWTVYSTTMQDSFGDDFEARCVRHTLGCLLARVAGRSQLEYLSAAKKHVQRDAVVRLMAAPPAAMLDLIQRFVEAIHDPGSN